MLQPRERLVERALLHEERSTRHLFDTEKHAVAVQLAERNGLEDQDVQCSRQKLGSRHVLSLAVKENNNSASAQVSKGSTVPLRRRTSAAARVVARRTGIAVSRTLSLTSRVAPLRGDDRPQCRYTSTCLSALRGAPNAPEFSCGVQLERRDR